MSYFPPYLDAAGLHLPTYLDRLESLLASYQTIFGPDVNLEESSPDYQLLSVFAKSLDDLSGVLLSVFASRNPSYAAGEALDLLLPLHGITREGATYSTVMLTLNGTPNAILAAAPQALDSEGHVWACQATGIQLDANGTKTVRAVCTTAGAITAEANTINQIVSPVTGLTSVNNASAATPGTDAETDASVRRRFALASSAPTRTIPDALAEAVAAVPNVIASKLYINDTDSTDANGIPAHSLCAVVQSGNANAIAKAIFMKKAPGIGTYGGNTGTVTDDFGVSHTVSFQRVSVAYVTLTIRLTALTGFNEDTALPAIRQAIMNYMDTLAIGQDLVIPALHAICYSAETNPTPTFAITQILGLVSGGTATSGVISATWKQRFSIPSASFITITVDS